VIEAYLECEINGVYLKSNVLKYYIICIERNNSTPIISSSFEPTDTEQYLTVSVPYQVYTPNSLTSAVKLFINGELYSERTDDQSAQLWQITDCPVGNVVLSIQTGSTVKTFDSFYVVPSEMDIPVKESGLELFLTASGKSNDAKKTEWVYKDIDTTFTNFNWKTDGWLTDDAGASMLSIQGNARATINLQPFLKDFKELGKTIEIEFEIKDVIDYDAIAVSCFTEEAGTWRGLKVGCKEATLKSSNNEISTTYKDNERIRIAFSIENTMENRIMYVYLNGILSGLAQYSTSTMFSQDDPVYITLGCNECTLNIYNIRIYNESMSSSEALNNYMYDMNDLTKKRELYSKNNVYDGGEISYAKLLDQIPCMTIIGTLPPRKGEKQSVEIEYVNKQDSSRNYSDTGVSIDIQGTSSQAYPKKNYKLKFNNQYKLRENSIEERVYTMKAD
jgi:hypothetical protein